MRLTIGKIERRGKFLAVSRQIYNTLAGLKYEKSRMAAAFWH